MNEMNPSLIDFDMAEVRRSKRDLNRNAQKFRLKELKSETLRYEVIYKNLIRDIRKYYSFEINDLSMLRQN